MNNNASPDGRAFRFPLPLPRELKTAEKIASSGQGDQQEKRFLGR